MADNKSFFPNYSKNVSLQGKQMRNNKHISLIVALSILIFLAIKYSQYKRHLEKPKKEQVRKVPDPGQKPVSPEQNPNREDGFNRRNTNLILTKHARCRMECRHIDESEIQEILAKGTINYQKSDLQNTRGPKYALEGLTRDKQRVRIIFAPEPRGMVVVTVIDLERDWRCDCD